MTDIRPPPKSPSAAIGQSRNWFLFNADGQPMVYRRKAIWQLVPGTNLREHQGDDYECFGAMGSAKLPPTVKDVLVKAWAEHSQPPLWAGA